MAVRNNSDALNELVNGVNGVEGLQSRIDTKAPLKSPALTGTPTAPTPAANDNSTRIATTAYVAKCIQNLINAAPAALDTLGELASALKNNPNAIQEILTALGNKADKAAGTSSTLGLTKLYTGTGSNTDGTMTQKAITGAIPTLASSTGASTTQGMTQKAITDAIDEKTKIINDDGFVDFTKKSDWGGYIFFAAPHSSARIFGDATSGRIVLGGCDLTLENGVISTNNITLKVGELWVGSKKVTV